MIYDSKELITSFDTFIAWRPWWHDPTWKPYVENLHTDQNPARKKGFHCVQGMIPLYKVDEVGGLAVVPDTNNDRTQDELADRYPYTEGTNSDWLELRMNDPFIGKGVLVKCQAGDLILWDSRSIHGGLILQPS
jgi:ectoine hydroxylase-related dioxygenase (phytanoyl-CoA dioxygenase family)